MRNLVLLVAAIALVCVAPWEALAKVDGAAVYHKCLGCHKATGLGLPGVFPPLAGHAAQLEKADRTYPIKALLFGLKGNIVIEGKKYHATMPSYGDKLNDDEIAAVLNYVLSSWGNAKMLPKGHKEIAASEVHALRGEALTPEQVYEARKKLKLE